VIAAVFHFNAVLQLTRPALSRPSHTLIGRGRLDECR